MELTLTVNLLFGPSDWIEPDLNVLRPGKSGTWSEASEVVMPIELLSPSTRHRDTVTKPALCAAAGIPYFMTVDVDEENRSVRILQSKLDGDRGEYRQIAVGQAGLPFSMTEPFRAEFDPAILVR